MANTLNIPPYCNEDDLRDAQNFAAIEAADFRPDIQSRILWAYLKGRSDYRETLLRREGLKDIRWMELLQKPQQFGLDGEAVELLHQALEVLARLAHRKQEQNPKSSS